MYALHCLSKWNPKGKSVQKRLPVENTWLFCIKERMRNLVRYMIPFLVNVFPMEVINWMKDLPLKFISMTRNVRLPINCRPKYMFLSYNSNRGCSTATSVKKDFTCKQMLNLPCIIFHSP